MNINKVQRLLAFAALALFATLTPAIAADAGLDQLVSVELDTAYCTTGGVQCTELGSAIAEPADGNNAAVRAVVQLTNPSMNPISSRAEGDFTIGDVFVPAGGTVPAVVSCSNCFASTSGGLYTVFIQPSNDRNWKSGTYVFQLEADLGPSVGRALVRIDVP